MPNCINHIEFPMTTNRLRSSRRLFLSFTSY